RAGCRRHAHTRSAYIPRPLQQIHDSSVTCVLPNTAYLGEGPVWSPEEQCLYWIDILAPAVHRFDPATGDNQTRALPRLIGAVALRQEGGLVAVTQDGLESLDFNSGNLRPIVDPEEGITDTRFNDARCDAAGRLWAGTMALDATPGRGAIYRFLEDGSWARAANGFTVSNGLDWSPDDRLMYFADSAAEAIFAFDFNLETGEITNRRPFIRTTADEGRPDGLTVDTEGCLWCAMWDGWAVRRYSPEGSLLQTVELPVPRPSSCVFGGPDLKTLYITSGRIRLSEELLIQAPLSGSLFALQTDVQGRPPNLF
ncbi:MAG: SMP-30/gluconolactonase/LRE family protein, partial [Pseudomonadota bacterium]